jgi:hypothetical protein
MWIEAKFEKCRNFQRSKIEEYSNDFNENMFILFLSNRFFFLKNNFFICNRSKIENTRKVIQKNKFATLFFLSGIQH